MSKALTEDEINTIVSNDKLPSNVKYAMLRQTICEHAKPEDRPKLLTMVGQQLGGSLVKGHPNYWLFEDGRKAKFDLPQERPATKMAQAFMKALQKK